MLPLHDCLPEVKEPLLMSPAAKRNFLQTLNEELFSVGRLYLDVARNPSLLAKGMYYVAKDIVYELPKSLIQKPKDQDLKTRLDQSASQALTLSEAVTVPGTYAGVELFKFFGADDYTASVVGGAVGNYVSGATSYMLSYFTLTRGNDRYSMRQAFIDGCRVVKDCLPTALALYATEAPIISGMLAAGIPRNMAVGINLAGVMALFTGVAKYSASRNLAQR